MDKLHIFRLSASEIEKLIDAYFGDTIVIHRYFNDGSFSTNTTIFTHNKGYAFFNCRAFKITFHKKILTEKFNKNIFKSIWKNVA
jgi:hypothetical protein